MPLEDKLCFVQFMHPGKEHRPDPGGEKKWNVVTQPHKRKFVEYEGRWVKNGRQFKGLMRFWTEWEPESNVVAHIDDPVRDGPKFVYKPFYRIPRTYRGLQNTDPFVFGGFYYTLCQQHRNKRPTQLRNLDKGSVILFGSSVAGHFAIDTVFVVCDWIDHDEHNFKKVLWPKVPEVYRDVTLSPWYQPNRNGAACAPRHPNQSWRLYLGATIDKPVDGMFSFFPCSPANSSPRGFARPQIANRNIITDGLLQGFRLKRGISPSDVKKHWTKVREQVESTGLWLGVYAEPPKRRNTVP